MKYKVEVYYLESVEYEVDAENADEASFKGVRLFEQDESYSPIQFIDVYHEGEFVGEF